MGRWSRCCANETMCIVPFAFAAQDRAKQILHRGPSAMVTERCTWRVGAACMRVFLNPWVRGREEGNTSARESCGDVGEVTTPRSSAVVQPRYLWRCARGGDLQKESILCVTRGKAT
jgi:hypothetical protein